MAQEIRNILVASKMCKEYWIAMSSESWPWVKSKETGVRDEAGVW